MGPLKPGTAWLNFRQAACIPAGHNCASR